jgi:hypothetical protein
MLRPTVSRRFIGIALAATAGAGIGVGAASGWAAWGSDGAPVTGTVPAAAPVFRDPASASGPLTPDQVRAAALRVVPGTVTEVEREDDAPGLSYEVTVQRSDGTEVDVVVDSTTGSAAIEPDDDQPDTTRDLPYAR